MSEKKKKNKAPKVYWTEDTESAVVEFLNLDYEHLSSRLKDYKKERAKNKLYDPTIDDGYIALLNEKIEHSKTKSAILKKEEIFNTRIKKPLHRLVESIIFSFGLFRDDIDVKTIHNDCMSHVYEKFYKFNPDTDSKKENREKAQSFSYYGTIAKHYLQNKKKELYISKTTNLHYDDIKESIDNVNNYSIDDTNEDDDMINLFFFIINSFEEYENSKALNDNDRRLLNSIVDLFKNHHDKLTDNQYTKSGINDYLKEESRLTQKEWSKSIIKIKNLYREKKKGFLKEKE